MFFLEEEDDDCLSLDCEMEDEGDDRDKDDRVAVRGKGDCVEIEWQRNHEKNKRQCDS